MSGGGDILFVLAGVLAAGASWVANRAALRMIGTKVIVLFSPLFEEAAKTGGAVLLGASVVLTHGVFGVIEGLYDALEGNPQGVAAGLTSVAGHLFYGYISSLVMIKFDSFVYAVAAGYLVHSLWNFTVMKFVVRRRKSIR